MYFSEIYVVNLILKEIRLEQRKSSNNVDVFVDDYYFLSKRVIPTVAIVVKLTGKWTVQSLFPTLFHFDFLIAIILSTNFLLIYNIFRLFKKLTKEIAQIVQKMGIEWETPKKVRNFF